MPSVQESLKGQSAIGTCHNSGDLKMRLLTLLFISTTTVTNAQDITQCPPEPEPQENVLVYRDLTGACDPSTITLSEPKADGAVATVTFKNTPVHGPQHSGIDSLYLDGFRVDINFTWTSGDDVVTIVPPDGYYADPSEVSVPEGQTQEYHIYRYLGM